jgi:membrane fusion protein, heavy metal efflux system
MKTILVSSALALLLASLFAGCMARSSDEQPISKEKEERPSNEIFISARGARDLGITLTTVEERSLQAKLSVPAHLVPNQDREAIVGTLLQGRVHQVLVNAGDRVTKGQALMLIEGLEIGEIKAEFIKARASLRYAEAAAKRQRLLREQNIGSEKAYLETEAELQKARAGFTAEDRKIHSIGLNDSDVEQFVDPSDDSASTHVEGLLPIRAPLSGIIAERNVVQGQLVEATTNAFRIVDTQVLWADGQVQERDLGSNLPGGPATLTVTAMPGRVFKGTIIFVSPVVDAQTRTVTVRAAIPNPRGVLKPNMFGELHFGGSRERSGLLIPGEAVVRIQDSTYVFVGLNDSLYIRKPVSLGTALGAEVEVVHGLVKGERVVANGSFFLKSEQLKESFGEEE